MPTRRRRDEPPQAVPSGGDHDHDGDDPDDGEPQPEEHWRGADEEPAAV